MRWRTCLTGVFLLGAVVVACLYGVFEWIVSGSLLGASISADGRHLLSTNGMSVSVFDLDTEQQLMFTFARPHGFMPNDYEYSNIQWSPDGTLVAVGTEGNGVLIWDRSDWVLETSKDGGDYGQGEAGFGWSPDSQNLILGANDGEVWLWSRTTNTWAINSVQPRSFLGATWDPDLGPIAVVGHEVVALTTDRVVGPLDHWIDGIGLISWAPNREHVFVFFDLGGGLMDVGANRSEMGAGFYPRVSWSHDGRYFAWSERCGNEIKVWDTVEHKGSKRSIQGGPIWWSVWHPDGALYAIGIRESRPQVWNVDTGEEILALPGVPDVLCLH